MAAAVLLIAAACSVSFASPQRESPDDKNTLIVDSSPDLEVITFSKKVIVKNEAKGVLVLGGDAVIEGRVTGDVATVGGSVIQREGAYIGGDVIVFGGRYLPDSAEPLRAPEKETVVLAAYENEFREMAQEPLSALSPKPSAAYLGMRVVSLLVWFILSLALAAIAPGAVSRAAARIQLSSAKVIGIGLAIFSASVFAGIALLGYFSNTVNAALIGLSALVLIPTYLFGRVVLHVVTGKYLHRLISPKPGRSEAVSMFLGTLAWTLLLSLPFVWAVAVAGVISAGVGLVFASQSASAGSEALLRP